MAPNMEGDDARTDSRGTRIERVREDISSRIDTGKEAIENMDVESVTGSLKRIPNAIRRNLANTSGTSMLTRAPAITVALCLLITGFFTLHSGILDCRDGFDNPDYCQEESALNVNGDLEVYLPEGNDVTELLASVEENWTTNVMVVYVESESLNVTSVEILEEIDAIERELNYARNDRGTQDNIIYLLSISTVIKEVNSSAGRIAKATFAALAEATGNGDLTDDFNDTIDEQQDIIGSYSIPDQQRVDQILDEMPQNALDKLVRDVGIDFNDDGITDQVTSGHGWNRAVIIIGIESDRNGDGIDDVEISELILETQGAINALGMQNNWADKNLTMTLTGPVPITNAVTEESFKLFWKVFPIGGIFVALGLFIFHCDLLQTGRIRWVQGLKVLIISGLPTLCSVWIN